MADLNGVVKNRNSFWNSSTSNFINKKTVLIKDMSVAKRVKIEKDENSSRNYIFQFREKPHYEFAEQINIVSGQVLLNKVKVGSISGHIFLRDECDGSFYSICDSISQEMNESSTSFFNDSAHITGMLKKLVSEESCYEGNYLHIEQVEIDEEHRGRDLGVLLFKKLLEFLAGRWTIAIIQPSPLHADLSIGTFRAGIVSLSQYFARLGFKQISTNAAHMENKFWYLEAVNYTGQLLSKDESKRIRVALELEPQELSETGQLVSTLIDKCGSLAHSVELSHTSAEEAATMNGSIISTFKDTLQVMIQTGVSLDEARALHVAVANKRHLLIAPLIELGASVNLADDLGSTPLHVAATNMDPKAITFLLTHGASKKLKNKAGETSLGTGKKALSSLKKFQKTMGLSSQLPGIASSLHDSNLCVMLLK